MCASAGRVAPAERAPAGTRERFEDSNRFVRGRVIAALAAGEPLPEDIAAERLERAVAGLVADGLVQGSGGSLSLPA
jgi:A/G-specific adenine glycosylase